MVIFLLLLGILQKREYDFFAERDHENERAAFISQYFWTGPVLNEKSMLNIHTIHLVLIWGGLGVK